MDIAFTQNMKEKKPKVSLKLVFYLILKKYKFI